MGQYVSIDSAEFKRFVRKLERAGRGDFKKELKKFLDGIGEEFLRIVQDEIIRTQTVDTRLLLNSFQKGTADGIYELQEGNLTLEVGTNVDYASYVNDGHWTNPQGVATRWVPGIWSGDRFIYQPGAKTGMLLKQKWVEGSHYFESAVRILETMMPRLMEVKLQQWIEQYFSEFL